MIFYNSSLPALTSYISTGAYIAARRLLARTALAVGAVTGLGAVGILLVGPWFVPTWTHGEVVVSRGVLLAFIVATVAELTWLVLALPDVATNRHFLVALTYTAGVTCAVASLAALGITNVVEAPIALAISSIPVIVIAFARRIRRTTNGQL